MKILIIAGFLGAGKTSFIKEMAKKTGRQFVIVENEFGELGIDGQLLNQNNLNKDDEEMKIWELSEGCICCSLNLDFTYSVLTIANSLNPDYLIVEPSGVAHPSKIISQINKITYDQIQLAAPVTIIDGLHYNKSRHDFPDYFNDQLNTAGTVVVSKSEKFSAGEFEDIKNDLKIPENVDFPLTHYSNWSKEEWEMLLNREMVVEKNETSGKIKIRFKQAKIMPKQQMENTSFMAHGLKNPDELSAVLELLNCPYFGKIVRSKGYMKLGSTWVKFDFVEGDYIITGTEEMPDERIVVIGQNINKDEIFKLFNPQ